jgi:peptide-methionine (S)-S-oxide reductase
MRSRAASGYGRTPGSPAKLSSVSLAGTEALSSGAASFGDMPTDAPPSNAREVATVGGGCFWCTEAVFSELQGVEQVLPGYAGGSVPNPSYEDVCTGATGHAEVVQVTFDPTQISYSDLLRIFFTVHDPTTLNRQGADVGSQYRSIILYQSPTQQQAAQVVMQEVTAEKLWKHPLVTELVPLRAFYPAEEYHRDYFRRNPNKGYCMMVISPKVSKFRKHYADRLRRPAPLARGS